MYRFGSGRVSRIGAMGGVMGGVMRGKCWVWEVKEGDGGRNGWLEGGEGWTKRCFFLSIFGFSRGCEGLRCQGHYVDEGVIEAMPLGRGLVVEQYPHCEGNMSSREEFQKKKGNPHSCIYKTKQRNRTPKSVSQAIPGSRDSSRNPNKSTADPLVPAKEWESISQYFRLRTSQLSCCPCVSTLDRQTEEPPLQRAPLCLSRPLGRVLTALTVVRLQQDKTAQVSKGTTFVNRHTLSATHRPQHDLPPVRVAAPR